MKFLLISQAVQHLSKQDNGMLLAQFVSLMFEVY